MWNRRAGSAGRPGRAAWSRVVSSRVGQAETGLKLADLPVVPHPVDEKLPGPRVSALLSERRAEVRPDDLEG